MKISAVMLLFVNIVLFYTVKIQLFNVEKSIDNELENALIHNKHLIKNVIILSHSLMFQFLIFLSH